MEPAGVAGVILDSSIIIAAERRGQTVRQILEHIRASQSDIETTTHSLRCEPAVLAMVLTPGLANSVGKRA